MTTKRSRVLPRIGLALWLMIFVGAMLTGWRMDAETAQALYWMAGVVLIWKSF